MIVVLMLTTTVNQRALFCLGHVEVTHNFTLYRHLYQIKTLKPLHSFAHPGVFRLLSGGNRIRTLYKSNDNHTVIAFSVTSSIDHY